ncbi:hypothetical protein FQR65_LT16346 [Abscondita terminalis]|nr:hypothetical protein FQR65_LT16346 [Abscondita terminalis]
MKLDRDLTGIKMQLRQILLYLNNNEHNSSKNVPETINENEIWSCLPLRNATDMEAFEKKITANDDYKSKLVDEKHWEIIANFIETYPVVATGKFEGPNGKSQYRKLWEDLTLQLNSAGLGQRTTEKWQKTWTDFKYALKKKASAYRQDLHQTGGGPAKVPKLTVIEIRMLQVLGNTFYAGVDVKEVGVCVDPNMQNSVTPPMETTSKACPDNIVLPHTSTSEFSGKRLKSYSEWDHDYTATKRRKEERPDLSAQFIDMSKQTLQELKELKTILKEGLANIADAIKSISNTNSSN